MCLFTIQNKPLKADKPIKVYKAVIKETYKEEVNYLNYYLFCKHRIHYNINKRVTMLDNLNSNDIRGREYEKQLFLNPVNSHCTIVDFAKDCFDQYKTINLEDEAVNSKELFRIDRGLFSFDTEKDDWIYTAKQFHNRIERLMSNPEYNRYCLNRYRDFCDSDLEVAVLECEIPVGAKYYKGYSYCVAVESAYVSDELYVVNDINYKFY